MTASHFFSSPREVEASKERRDFHDYIIEKLRANEFWGGPTKSPPGAVFILLHLNFFTLSLRVSQAPRCFLKPLSVSASCTAIGSAVPAIRHCSLSNRETEQAEQCHLPSLTPENSFFAALCPTKRRHILFNF